MPSTPAARALCATCCGGDKKLLWEELSLSQWLGQGLSEPKGVKVGKVLTREQASITVFELIQWPSDGVLSSSKEILNWLGLNRTPFYCPHLFQYFQRHCLSEKIAPWSPCQVHPPVSLASSDCLAWEPDQRGTARPLRPH